MSRMRVVAVLLLSAAAFTTAASALAQAPSEGVGISFEAALKRACPAKNLEFLPPDVLAKTTDGFVAGLPQGEADQVRALAKDGVEACTGSADDSCRTAALLGTIRYLRLSEPLAARFCALPLACTDWFACGDDRQQTASGAVAAPAPGAPRADDEVTAGQEPEAMAQEPEPPGPQRQVAPEARPEAPVVGRRIVPRAQEQRAQEPTARELAQGLDVPPEEDEAPAPPPPPPPTRRAPQGDGVADVVVVPATPRQAVEGFYRALGRGDGIAAASYLIPEKRGRGNYSAAAMQRFYGSLPRRLALRSVEPLGPDTLRVRYDFATRGGGTCDGHAIVSVRPTPAGTYINAIRALSGC
jgi:hypothetical protein